MKLHKTYVIHKDFKDRAVEFSEGVNQQTSWAAGDKMAQAPDRCGHRKLQRLKE